MSDTDATIIYVYDENIIVVEAVPAVEVVSTEVETVILEIDAGPQGPPGPEGPTGPGASDDVIKNITPPGGYRVTNIRMDANKRLLFTYEEDPIV